jgi:hypothetical protein
VSTSDAAINAAISSANSGYGNSILPNPYSQFLGIDPIQQQQQINCPYFRINSFNEFFSAAVYNQMLQQAAILAQQQQQQQAMMAASLAHQQQQQQLKAEGRCFWGKESKDTQYHLPYSTKFPHPSLIIASF